MTINELWGSGDLILPTEADRPIRLKQDAEPNVIYLNPDNAKREVSLQNVEGHGLLLIDGSASFSGGFSWYGLIIASGGIKFTGVGGDKNITGAAMVGESGVLLDSKITGSVAVLYCSTATNHLSTAVMISWREIREVRN